MEEILNRLLERGITQFHVVKECEDILRENAFVCLDIAKSWRLECGGRYYVKPYPSMLIAFTVSDSAAAGGRLSIGLAHTDFPMLKLKTKPDMNREGYVTLNVEPYGGLLKSTWFDRPLGMAGKVVIETDNPFRPQVELYSSDRAMCIIPSLAPHLKKDSDEAHMDVQKELIPVAAIEGVDVTDGDIISLVAADMGIERSSILDYDIYLYNLDKPERIGKGGLLSSPRIDNVTSVAALLYSICGAYESEEAGINVISLFDNEEIGSRSKQGADSVLLSDIIERIMTGAGLNGDRRYEMLGNAFMMSLDVAHAAHPNYPEKGDPTNKVVMGHGVALKSSAGQRYVSDSEAAAVIMALSGRYGISVQRQVNRSGMPGGQTLGPIASSYLPVKAVDMGIPVLAMHSARELCCIDDYRQLVEVCRRVFGTSCC